MIWALQPFKVPMHLGAAFVRHGGALKPAATAALGLAGESEMLLLVMFVVNAMQQHPFGCMAFEMVLK